MKSSESYAQLLNALCIETTSNYGEDLSIHFHEARHIVSIVDTARIKGFAQSELIRTKGRRIKLMLPCLPGSVWL